MRLSFKFSPDIPTEAEKEIQSRLSAIELEHEIRFLFAIESGSRAWGFPSPDSDYDVRFVYAHLQDWYLSIAPGRDVVETPLDGDWDVNGWDIRKAIGLLLKPNPVLLEWLSSPIRYRWNETACQKLSKFAEDHIRPEECLNHYYHLAKRQWERTIERNQHVNLKKYFYALRPALAIRWVRLNPNQLPPMNFQDLISATEIPEETLSEIAVLLHAKSQTSEIGTGPRIESIDALILREFDWVERNGIQKQKVKQDQLEAANQLFRDLIR